MNNTETPITTGTVELASRRAYVYLGQLRQARRAGVDQRVAKQAYAKALHALGLAILASHGVAPS